MEDEQSPGDLSRSTGWAQALQESTIYVKELDRLFPGFKGGLTLDQKGSIIASQLTQFLSDHYVSYGLQNPPKVHCVSEKDLDVVLSCAARTVTSDSRVMYFTNTPNPSDIVVRVKRADQRGSSGCTADKAEVLLCPTLAIDGTKSYKTLLAFPWGSNNLAGMPWYSDCFSTDNSEMLQKELNGKTVEEAEKYIKGLLETESRSNGQYGESIVPGVVMVTEEEWETSLRNGVVSRETTEDK